MRTGDHAWYVFHHEDARLELNDEAQEMEDEVISRIVEHAVTDQGEPLTRGAADHYINFSVSQTGPFFQVGRRQFAHVSANSGRVRKVEMMYGRVNRVKLHCRGNIETRLFE